MDKTKLQPGTRIYYTGDMANSEDHGVITKRYNDRWGDFVDITLDDGREFRGVYVIAFEPGPGRRFMLEEEWQEQRNAAVNNFNQRYALQN